MENASKALLMAGGILIAIVIIAVLVRSYTNISSFQKAQLSEQEIEQIAAFNEQYTKYVGQYVYGTEVITLINKYNDNKQVMVNIIGTYPSIMDGQVYYYKCTGIGYDGKTGKVNSINFSEVVVTSNE